MQLIYVLFDEHLLFLISIKYVINCEKWTTQAAAAGLARGYRTVWQFVVDFIYLFFENEEYVLFYILTSNIFIFNYS